MVKKFIPEKVTPGWILPDNLSVVVKSVWISTAGVNPGNLKKVYLKFIFEAVFYIHTAWATI